MIEFVSASEVEGPPAPQERGGRIEYLYLSDEQRTAVQDLDAAIDEVPETNRVRCRTPEVRTQGGATLLHYPHTDYDERTPPTQEEARLMCSTSGQICPVADKCYKLGIALEAPVGVWGGEVLVDGKNYYKKESKNG